MKNFTRRGMALLLSVLLLCSLSVGALAADEVGITAVLDNAKLTKSDTAQTVTLTVAPATTLELDSYQFHVNVPEGWSITAISNDDANAPLTAADYNAANGTVLFNTSDAENHSISKFAVVTISVPANAAADTYTITVDRVVASADYGSTFVLTNATTATATLTIEDGSVNPPEPVIPEGYSVAASGDAGINVGEDSTVALNVTHKDGNAYNAYYFEVSYDKDVLTYKSADVQDVVVDEAAGTLKIAGYGANKDSGTAAVTLTFTGKAVGAGKVTITKANVDAKANANAQDAPAANIDETTAAATITVGGYSVTLPEGFTGAASAEAGKDYTFTGGDDHGCYDVTATMGGADTTVENDGNGGYTIKNVTGEIVVKATPKSYKASVDGSGKAQVTLPAEAPTYKSDYKFTLTEKTGCTYTVTVTVGGKDYTGFSVSNGTYTIPGTDVKGDIVINVTETAPQPTTTTITIEGVTAEEVTGGLTHTADNGKNYTITLIKQADCTYTVKANGEELTVGEDGSFTIPGRLLTGTALTVTVTKTSTNPYSVEVYEYVQLDGKSIWLIVAKSENVLSYGSDVMFTSEKYGGYCWLEISADGQEAVKTAAIEAVKVGGSNPTAVNYDGNVNCIGVVDVNDAQLVYNMYNAMYSDFNATTRAMFLAADVAGDDMKVNTLDAAKVVNTVLGING